MNSLVCIVLAALVIAGLTTPAAAQAPPHVTPALTGAALPGANGMALDAQGRLLVVNAGASRITAIDPDDGTILERFTPAADGVTYPDDVAVGTDGSVYWTEFGGGDVVRRTPGGRTRAVAALGPGANPIAFSPDGRLFVAQCFLDDALWEVDPRGLRAPRLVAEDIGEGCAANGMDFGPDGLLYAPQPLLGRIVAIDVDTAAVDVVAEGFGPALFGVDVAPDGTLYAVDSGVLRSVDIATGASRVTAELGFLADNLVISDAGRIFVSSLTDAAVVEVLADGTSRVVSPGGLVLPQGLGLAPDGSLLVTNGSAVTRFDLASGLPLDVLGTGAPFTTASLYAQPDRWVTTGPLERTVRLFDPAARTSTVLAEGLAFPLDAVLLGDDALVADGGAGKVLRVPLDDAAQRTTLRTLAETPAGLTTLDGDAWVSDLERGRILQIIDDGRPLRRPRVIARGLDRPQALAPGRPGELVAVETGAGRVVAVDLATHHMTVLTTGLTGADPAPAGQPTDGLFSGITAAPDGTVYVSDPLTNRVLRIERAPSR